MEIVTDFIIDILVAGSEFARTYISAISFAFVATLLVIYGGELGMFFRRKIASFNYVLRITLFVLFCAVGFSVLTEFLVPIVINELLSVSDVWLMLVLIASFYGLGYLAQRKGMV
jgi:hypothetical protein